MADNTTNSAPVAPTPVAASAAMKVYPTSYLPTKAALETPRKQLAELQGWHIEAVHIVIFFTVIFGLFLARWKHPNLR